MHTDFRNLVKTFVAYFFTSFEVIPLSLLPVDANFPLSPPFKRLYAKLAVLLNIRHLVPWLLFQLADNGTHITTNTHTQTGNRLQSSHKTLTNQPCDGPYSLRNCCHEVRHWRLTAGTSSSSLACFRQ